MTDPDELQPEIPPEIPIRYWNALFYLAGENNLAEECVFALKGLKRARPVGANNVYTYDLDDEVDAKVKVVAQLDASGLGGDELRYVLTRGDGDGILKTDEREKIDTTETSYRGVLKDFISESIIKYDLARKYLVVLSGHGNGIISDFLSRDVETPDKLSIPKIQWVFDEVKHDLAAEFGSQAGEDFMVDILGLDSCMMSMAEIAYELRHNVRYLVGAEGFEPNTGWPYEQILSAVLTNCQITPDVLAKVIVERYVNYYKDFLPAGRSVDQSACDLSKCEDLARAIKDLANILIKRIEEPTTMRSVVLAHWEAQSYKDDQYVDLYDFCDLLDRGSAEDPVNPTGSRVMRGFDVDEGKAEDLIRPACKKIKNILRGDSINGEAPNPANGMILKSCYSGPAVQYSYGLSVYFPWSKVVDTYKELEFAKATNWEKFLLKYIDVTRRVKRPCPTAGENAEVVKGELFFNPVIKNFDFLWTDNKNAPTYNRVLGNKVGSMKNPAIDFVPCECPETEIPDYDAQPQDPQGTQEAQRTPEAVEDLTTAPGDRSSTSTLKS
ncbi:MAG TPA: clostripain-related cysteine peptidase [Pyrinomonadaceae bacterium]|nr:clostripain-related cysteine peptidase [Pyrinomonadaceae bacterium]